MEGLLSSLKSFTYHIVPGSPPTLSQLSVVTRNITAAILDPPHGFKTCTKSLDTQTIISKRNRLLIVKWFWKNKHSHLHLILPPNISINGHYWFIELVHLLNLSDIKGAQNLIFNTIVWGLFPVVLWTDQMMSKSSVSDTWSSDRRRKTTWQIFGGGVCHQ
jgi:hypothetical protein